MTTPPSTTRLHTWAYRLAAVLALAYVVYVLWLKLAGKIMGGPLGEVGEFLLVLIAVTAFAIGLFVDEARRQKRDEPGGPAG